MSASDGGEWQDRVRRAAQAQEEAAAREAAGRALEARRVDESRQTAIETARALESRLHALVRRTTEEFTQAFGGAASHSSDWWYVTTKLEDYLRHNRDVVLDQTAVSASSTYRIERPASPGYPPTPPLVIVLELSAKGLVTLWGGHRQGTEIAILDSGDSGFARALGDALAEIAEHPKLAAARR